MTPQLDMIEKEHEEEGMQNENVIPTYNMTEQEQRAQYEEDKFNVYISTFTYEGDDLELEMESDSDSNATAYPYLE